MGSQAFHIGADLLKNYAMQEVKTGARATLTKGLVAIGGDAVAGLLGPMGWAAAIFSFGGSLIGKAARGLQALVGLKTPNDKETNLLIWGIVAIVALTPMTLALLQLDVPNSSLATRLPRGGASSSNGTFPGSPGSGGVPLPTYTPDPKTPLVPSQVTDCPTKNVFQLTQCPDGKYSHKNIMCAYDIGMADGTPIYATHNGIVSLYLPQGSSSGYGNMVEIMGKTPSGQTYYTLYGHLRTAALPVGSQVIAGQTIIGYSDNTGNSSGSHLHYELRSSTNAVLPDCGIHFLPAYCVSNPGYCNL
jgi:murein DD-endopeptidase MepM/ murein hydrolase activator NlpD